MRRRNDIIHNVTADLRRFPKALLHMGLGAAAVIFLAACEKPAFMTPKATVYDGAWVGSFQMTSGTRECKLKRGGIRLRVEGGELDGRTRVARRNAPFNGFIDEAGQLQKGFVKAPEFRKNDVEVVGQFGDRDAEGTWKSRDCKGSWELRKVR